MDDATQAARKCVGLLDKLLATLDKYNFLPMWKFRRQNMLDTQAIKLELEEKERTHKRKMEFEDARARALILTMENSSTLALEAARKDMENGLDLHEALAKNDPSTVYAASYLFKDALEGQNARERTGLYAALFTVNDPAPESVSEEEPSGTWMHHFTKFVSDLRDEEAYELWGKVLAGEIKKPGTFSLRFLNILATLDQRDAETFKRLAPYFLPIFVPNKIREQLGITVYDAKTLESLGLVMTDVSKTFDNGFAVANRYYIAGSTAEAAPKKISIPAIVLTPAGEELMKLVTISKEDALKGISSFADLAKSEYGQELQIRELPVAS